MESSKRSALTAQSLISGKTRSLQPLLESSEYFVEQIEAAKMREIGLLETEKEMKRDEVDISVCVRVRPMLSHETSFFSTVSTLDNHTVMTSEPRVDFANQPRLNTRLTKVDVAFGMEQDNDHVCDALATPLILQGLKGGVATLMAYGQTGSGKTFTISALLQRMASDLFKLRDELMLDKSGSPTVELYVSFFELLGNEARDLLKTATDSSKLTIMEDKFGQVVIGNGVEKKLENPSQFLELINLAMSTRHTEATFKNDTSSRSHAVALIRIKNLTFSEAEDGRIAVIDLAGSENAGDSQFHDRQRVKETQQINTALMALKECIRNRALATVDPDTFYHIPYRRSKLTLLLKDAFDLESYRQTRTVVIACVAPSCADTAMTVNTLRYVAPLKVVVPESMRKKEINPANPAHWSNDKLKKWVQETSRGLIDPNSLCRDESGRQLLRVPETEFLKRVLDNNPKVGEKFAKNFYTKLWSKLIDARTSERKDKLRRKKKELSAAEEGKEYIRILVRNEKLENQQQQRQEN